jgi:hypothetical protein
MPGITMEGDPRHAQAIIEEMGLKGGKGASTPCDPERVVDSKGEYLCDAALGVEDARRYRGLTARLNYLAQDRPDLKFASLVASRRMSCPISKDWEILKRVARYLILRPKAQCMYKWQDA